MAMTAVAVKAALTALTDERTRKNVGWIAAAILAPIILIAPLLLSLLSGTTQHNNAAVDLVFNGGVIPSTVSAEYAAQVRIMQTCLGMLDSTVAKINSQAEDETLDGNWVKAVFFSLCFGDEHLKLTLSEARDFADCFVRYEERTRTVASGTAPDSGDTSGSRQTLVTGEATRRACEKLKAELDAGKSLADLKGTEFYGEYLAKTDPLGADVPNPVSHVAYGYATQMCILDKETGRIKKMVAAHDVGKAVNPLSVEGQIEGGVVMSMGYALTEKYPIDENCKPTAKYGMLGLFRANQIPPEIQAIVVEKPGLNVAGGAIGIGEITSIPTAPAIADAYYRLTGEREFSLPLKNTPYAPKK